MTAADKAAVTEHVTEWAVQCHTRDGELYTGRAFTTREEAEQSGERLTAINGADWWLMSRTRVVTVKTTPWTRVTPERTGR